MNCFYAPFLKKFAITLAGFPLMIRFEKKTKNIKNVQDALLAQIISNNKSTRFGKEHNFSFITNYEQYKAYVPVRDYENHRPYIEKMTKGEDNVLVSGKPFFYNTTSGTTDKPKFIPVTKESFKAYGKISTLWFYNVLKDNPGIFNGFSLSVVAPALDGTVEDGTPYGSISGVSYKKIPALLKKTYSVPYPVICIRDYQKKYYGLALGALARNITYIICPSPSNLIQINRTIVENFDDIVNDIRCGTIRQDVLDEIPEEHRNETRSFFGKPDKKRADELVSLKKKYGSNLTFKHYWKNLSCINCWKLGNFRRLIPQIELLVDKKTKIRAFGYQASEARVGIVVDNFLDTSVLLPEYYFYEFIRVEDWDKEDPPIYRAHELESGVRYYIIITNNSGLYRYNINDIVEVKGFYNRTPRIIFVQKGEGITSITGEKLSEEQIIIAMDGIKKSIGIENYHMICDEKNFLYKLFVEFSKNCSPEKKEKTIPLLDSRLKELNLEYEVKRKSGRLKQPVLVEMVEDSYLIIKETMIKNGLAKEGQFKDCFLSKNIATHSIYETVRIK